MDSPTQANESLRASFRRRLAQAGYIPLAAMLLFALLMGAAVDRLLRSARDVDRTHAVIAQANRCFLLAVDMQSGARGFQLTGATNFLSPYLRARAELGGEFGRLRELISDPDQLSRAREIERRVQEFAAFSQGIIDRRASGEDVLSPSLNSDAKARFDQIRADFAQFSQAEDRLLRERSSYFTRFSRGVVAFRLTGALALAGALGWILRRQLRSVAASYEHSLRQTQHSEERYRQLAAELEGRVAERTRELTAANERLKEVDRLKSEFLATMSHELRTPLNSIIGFNEIIAAGLVGPVNDEQKRQLGMSLTSARHLLQLINDLLDLARIESGKLQLYPDWVELPAMVEQVANTLQPIADKKSIALKFDTAGDARLFIDRKMIFQILLNLANNAVKFTEKGAVSINAINRENVLTLTVRDTGIGIRAEDQRLLFEAFRQVDGSARRRFEGTGLGLYLCKRLADLLGGKIAVQSEPGIGSTFAVTIPWTQPK